MTTSKSTISSSCNIINVYRFPPIEKPEMTKKEKCKRNFNSFLNLKRNSFRSNKENPIEFSYN